MIPLYPHNPGGDDNNENKDESVGNNIEPGPDTEERIREITASFRDILKNVDDYKKNATLNEIEGSKLRFPTSTNKKMLGYKMIRNEKQRSISSVEFHKELHKFKSKCRLNGNMIMKSESCDEECQGDDKTYNFSSKRYVNFAKESNVCSN